MSDKPKTLTPQQAVTLARKYLNMYLDADNWHEELVEKWPQELEDDYRLLLDGGTPVVARDEAAELRALVGRLVKEVGYRTLDWAGTVCSYCGADQPGSEHWEDCIVLVAERRLAGGESER